MNWVEAVGERHFLGPCKDLGEVGAEILPPSFNCVFSTIKGFGQMISKDLIAHSSKILLICDPNLMCILCLELIYC